MIEQFIRTKSNSDLLCKTILGLERETIRTVIDGGLSKTLHPRSLGMAMTHPLIKTDFCEAQVEYATKPSYRLESVLCSLEQLHNYTAHNIPEGEFLWPFSMPPSLPEDEIDIPLAVYGDSKEGIMKTVYRRGLGHRYGRRMQTISGVHINISFSRFLMNWVSENRFKRSLNMRSQTQLYLDSIRNFNRYSFILIYLFGSSPAMDKTFSKSNPNIQTWKKNSWISNTATSIRLSELGYTSQVQNSLYIGFNSIEEFINDIGYAISTVFPSYSLYNNSNQHPNSIDGFKHWNQLNDFYLQIENEYYSLIRPKQIPYDNERPINSIENRGIRYLEVRCVDSDPFSPSGVNKDTVAFNQLFLLYCLLIDSPFMDDKEKKDWDNNQSIVVWKGRDTNSKYKVFGESMDMKSWFNRIYPDLEKVAVFWDNADSCRSHKSTIYINSLLNQKSKIENMELLPSSKVCNLLLNKDIEYLDLGKEIGMGYKKNWMNYPLDSRTINKLNAIRKESFNER